MTTSAIENYLKAIYQLQENADTVMTSAIAEALGVSAASATGMVKKLARLKLVRHSPYYGVELLPAGEKIALEVIRHHRLIELFLTEALGVPWDRVHAEAEKIEHVISEDLEERISQFLGEPIADPHGDPIPTKAGRVSETASVTLNELAPGQSSIIERITDQTPEHLRHFSSLGLLPEVSVMVVDREPFEGPLRVRVGSGAEHVLDEKLALGIRVQPIQTTAEAISPRAQRRPRKSSAVLPQKRRN